MKITHLLSNFKQDIIKNMATQLDTLQAKKKHEDVEAMLVEYYPHCRQKKKDCRCKMVANIESKQIPPEFNPIDGDDEQIFYIAQRRSWAPRQGMPPDPLSLSGPHLNSYAPNSQWQPSYPQSYGKYLSPPQNNPQNTCPITKIPHLNGSNPRGIGRNLKEAGNHLKETGNKHPNGQEGNNGQTNPLATYSYLYNLCSKH